MAEELSVKDKIALFSRKKTNPVTPESTSKASSTTSVKFTEKKRIEPILSFAKINHDTADGERDVWKTISLQEDQINLLKAELVKIGQIVEVYIN